MRERPRFAHREPADGVSRKLERGHLVRGAFSEPVIEAALHDREQALARVRVRRPPALRPRHRPPVRLLRRRAVRGVAEANVERHDDVGAEHFLDPRDALGREMNLAPLDGRSEYDAVVGDPAQSRQTEHLEAAAVGEDRAVPVHEPVEAPGAADELGTGTQHQVKGVGEHDLRARVAHLFGRERAHGSVGTDRHERGRLHASVGRVEPAGARARAAVGVEQREPHHPGGV